MPPLRCLQTLTAAAALFAVLGACGLAPTLGNPRPIVRPRPPRAELTIRSLTGTWHAVWQTADAIETLTLSIVQRGDALVATFVARGRALSSDTARPAHLDASGHFSLGFGQSHESIVVQGRPDITGDRIFVSIRGLSTEPVVVTFRRQ